MSWIRRFANLLRSNRHARDIDRELAFHVGERADDLVAAGMTRELAEREARRRFGNYGAQKENTRDADIFTWLDAMIDDTRYAIRMLRHSPAFTLVTVLSLALGIGANTAIFTLINAVMLRSLPVAHPEELVQITMPGGNRVVHESGLGADSRQSENLQWRVRLRDDAVQSRHEWRGSVRGRQSREWRLLPHARRAARARATASRSPTISAAARRSPC